MNLRQLLLVFFLLCVHAGFSQAIRYVKPGSTGTGISWSNASGDIQAMINTSIAGDQIWVAAGTYKPNRRADTLSVINPNNPNNAFVLKAGVKLYGGFAGTETTLTARNWTTNVTTLSGDIGVPNDSADNCYHVVICANAVSNNDTAVFDGFTVTRGNARNNTINITVNGRTIAQGGGGGICSRFASSYIANCTITRNSANEGAGMFGYQSKFVMDNCHVTNNTAGSVFGDGEGGGVDNLGSSSIITNCVITGNSAMQSGGGIYYHSNSMIVDRCIITGNTAYNGGGICTVGGSAGESFSVIRSNISGNTGAGILDVSNYAFFAVANCIISNNSGEGISSDYTNVPLAIVNCAITGNGGYGINNHISASGTITNCTIAGNGGGVYTYTGSNAAVNNCIVWNNSSSDINSPTAVVTYSIVQGGYAGVGNSSSDPLFINAATGDYKLQAGSPAIDLGSNTAYSAVANINTDKDLADHPRLTATTIDIGAYEACTITTGTDAVTACGNYTWSNGITYTASNNTATDTFINATGCDSVVTLNLTINPMPSASIITNAAVAIVAQTNANYQWINCTTGAAVAGAVGQSFTATTAGSYKVVVSLNDCSDTSDCVNLAPTGIKETGWSNAVNISPNPAKDIVTISFNGLEAGKLLISVVDVQGRMVFQSEEKVFLVNHKTSIDLRQLVKGFYLVKFSNGHEFGTKKLVVQ